MRLHELLNSVNLAGMMAELPVANPDVLSITTDSRKATADSLFFALPGLTVDGRDYIGKAAESGAAAVVYEAEALSAEQQHAIDSLSVPAVGLAGLRNLLGLLAASFYGEPCTELKVFGVTGTNGKTSCAYLLTQCLQALGYKTAFIGTIGYGDWQSLQSVQHTTADAIELQQQLAELRDNGFSHVCMEVSSHALDQQRVAGMSFYGALFTNLSHEHLDYHQTMEAYAAAKRRLFTDFSLKFAVLNADDEKCGDWLDVTDAEFIATFGEHGDVRAVDVAAEVQGLSFYVETDSVEFPVTVPLVGEFNVANALLVVTALLILGVEVDQIQRVMSMLKAAPGRMEVFAVSGRPVVVVDYAHTPEALEFVLQACQKHCSGKLLLVFGCGGDRDAEKRPLMGRIAEQFADSVVVTNDNPRSEQPEAIFADIVAGMQQPPSIIEDRSEAIRYSIDQAEAGDWVLVAGRGHEEQQIIGDKTLSFSDRQWVQQCLQVAA